MKSGALKRRVDILAPTQVRLTSGGFKTSWSLLITVWASVEPLSGREFYSSKQVDSDVTHNIIMRYNKSGLLPSYRLVHQSQIFEISSRINIEEENRQITVKAIERTGTVKEFISHWEDGAIAHWEDGTPVFWLQQ